MAGLSWSVKLDDKISAGANAASAALGVLATKLKETRERKRLFDTEMARATGQAAKSGAAADAFRQATGLEAARVKATEAARAMDRLRTAAKAAASAPLLNGRAVFGKTGANGAGLFGGAHKELSLFSRAVQAAGNAFGAKGANSVMALGRAFDFVGQRASFLKPALSGLVSVAKVAMTALAAIGGVAIGLGIAGAKYVIEAQSFKQSTMFAFKNLLGSQQMADEAWRKVKATSMQTGMGLQDTAGAMNRLLAVGFDLPMADKLIKQMADLKTLNPAANLEGIARAIGQIKNTGKLQGDELMQLADAGLSVDAVYKQLEKQTGKTRAEILKMQAAGKIDSDMAIKAIQDSMSEQTGRAPGELAAEATRTTMIGALGKLMAVKDAFVDGLKFDFTPISRFLDKVSTALSGDAGKELGASFEMLFGTVMGLLDGITAKDVAGFFSDLASAIRGTAVVISFTASAVKSLRDAWGWVTGAREDMNGLAGTLTTIPAGIAYVGSAIVNAILGPFAGLAIEAYGLLQQIGDIDTGALVAKLGAAGMSIGSALVQGLLNAMTGGLSSVFAAGMALADAASSGTTTAAEIKSPSRLFGRHGQMMVAGAVDSLRAGAGAMFGAGAGLANAASSGAGTGSASVGVTREGGSFADMYPQLFAAYRSPAEAAAAPSSAASIGTAAANVTNNTTTASRGPVSLQVTVQNADEAKIAGLIESRFRAMDLVGG